MPRTSWTADRSENGVLSAQLADAHVIDDVFALCFGSVEGDGALVLGAAPLPPGVTLLYTPLLRSQVLHRGHDPASNLNNGAACESCNRNAHIARKPCCNAHCSCSSL